MMGEGDEGTGGYNHMQHQRNQDLAFMGAGGGYFGGLDDNHSRG